MKGANAKDAELTFDGEVPWISLEKKAAKDDNTQVFKMHIAATRDIFPREGRITIKNGKTITITQPGLDAAKCKNALAFFAPYYIGKYENGTATPGERPSKWNIAKWVSDATGANPFSTYIPFKIFKGVQKTLSMPIPNTSLTAYVPTLEETAILQTPAFSQFGTPFKDKELVVRYEFVELGERFDAKITARHYTEETADIPKLKWDDALAGSDVVRYLVNLGMQGENGAVSAANIGYFWTQSPMATPDKPILIFSAKGGTKMLESDYIKSSGLLILPIVRP